MIFDFYH